MDSDTFYNRAFSRNRGLISSSEQLKLRNTRVAIVGMGGMGGVHAATLARTGIGRFTIADFDEFEVHNINRQFGATKSTLGKDKAAVMADIIRDINPSADIKILNAAVDETNVDEFLQDVDVVIDGLDVFAIQARRLIFSKARALGAPVISTAPLGFGALMLVFAADGMDFDAFTGINDGMTEGEMAMAFLGALGSQGPHIKYMNLKKVDSDTGGAPSVGLACQIAAGMTAVEVVCHITGRRKAKPIPWITQFDPYARIYTQRHRRGGAKNPIQRLRMVVMRRLMSGVKP